ncbi:MAG: family transcriptional regulator [Ferruginibacter sp.]|nr:family transcriptional regulator [Ferruginibacter sp.]
MKASKIIREKLGFTQEEMAQYLSITRSLLALYENGRRDLPTAAFVKLAEIESFLTRSPPPKESSRPHIKLQQKKAQKLLDDLAKQKVFKKELLNRKLVATQKVYDQHMLLLNLLDHLKSSNKRSATNRIHPAWLAIMEAKALEEIEQNGLHVQAMLEAQIAS